MSKDKQVAELTENELIALRGRSRCCELKKSKINVIKLELLMLEESYGHCLSYISIRHGLDLKKEYALKGNGLIEVEELKVTKIHVD